MSWKAELDDGSGFGTNYYRFATKEEAESHASEVFNRWFGAKLKRTTECGDEVNAKWLDGRVVPLPDLEVTNEGSIFLLRPVTKRGKDWVSLNIPSDAQTFGPSIVVEHRFIADIVASATADGLKVS